MKKTLLTLLLLLSFAQADEENLKVVYDLTTKNVAKLEQNILKGIVAHKAYFQKDFRELDVTIVIHGGAYRYFVKEPSTTLYRDDYELIKNYTELKKRLASLADTYDVEFLMCGVGMRANKLQEKDIVPYVKVIPNSTIGLIERQNEGYAYIPVQ
ncbi:DsrE family protein [Sulfurimonas sp. SAG-AH-194-L11]|nr:DsrE family protein [Sulfurimonas sp. SAG-AH-194-L11]MDF1876651.1 DsrE family protein [Sulfurimonas sp. SAG-AH-194-L11]